MNHKFKLSELISRNAKSKLSVNTAKAMAVKNGDLTCFTSGATTLSLSLNNPELVTVQGKNLFVNDGGVADIKYFTGPATYTDHVICYSAKCPEQVPLKFIYYTLKDKQEWINQNLFNGVGVKNINRTKFEALEVFVPMKRIDGTSSNHELQWTDEQGQVWVPDTDEMNRIVNILDKFTELETELETELDLRVKQYEYYRDKLLDFGQPSTSSLRGSDSDRGNPETSPTSERGNQGAERERERVEWVEMGRIASYRRGSFPQPYGESRWYDGEGSMPLVQVADVANNMQLVKNTKKRISKEAQPMSVFAPKDTIVVTLQGSIGRVAITQYDSYVDRTLAIFGDFKLNINKKYFAYQLERKFGFEKLTARGSTIKTITKEEFTNFKIPIPPLSTQHRIVKILDKFSALTTDIKAGLPAEIAGRRKQYEYYRNKLLTFK